MKKKLFHGLMSCKIDFYSLHIRCNAWAGKKDKGDIPKGVREILYGLRIEMQLALHCIVC